nr:glycosyltransferase [Flexivirga meconopsidis]
MPTTAPPDWAGASWVGELLVGDFAAAPAGAPLEVPDVGDYRHVRLLVREHDRIRGYLTPTLIDGHLDPAELHAGVAALPPADVTADAPRAVPISVVLCTRDRPDDLRMALRSLIGLDYPDFEIVVVDNAPTTSATTDTVANIADPRIRVTTEPVPGLSRARNAGVASARHDWIAFTDDDVVVDPGWLRGVARAIGAGGPQVGVVTGPVATAELRTAAQAWFDRRVSWNKFLLPRVFDIRRPPPELPLFPFQVGAYGTGANFTTSRRVLEELGGFDVRLGAGTPTRGGEDIDFFYRVVVRGHLLAYEPSALVWHRHRDTLSALETQSVGYGRGLAAWLTKLTLSPRDLLTGLVAIGRNRRRRGRGGAPATGEGPDGPDQLDPLPGTDRLLRLERRSVLGGPASYLAPWLLRE